jgi:hypothetical protein
MTIFDEYANILKSMYSIRFNGRSDLGGTSARPDTGRSDHEESQALPVQDPMSLPINSLRYTTVRKSGKRTGRQPVQIVNKDT